MKMHETQIEKDIEAFYNTVRHEGMLHSEFKRKVLCFCIQKQLEQLKYLRDTVTHKCLDENTLTNMIQVSEKQLKEYKK